jgi:hypothetical protein
LEDGVVLKENMAIERHASRAMFEHFEPILYGQAHRNEKQHLSDQAHMARVVYKEEFDCE